MKILMGAFVTEKAMALPAASDGRNRYRKSPRTAINTAAKSPAAIRPARLPIPAAGTAEIKAIPLSTAGIAGIRDSPIPSPTREI